MFTVFVASAEGRESEVPIEGRVALVGKARHCDVRLGGWRVGREHARIFRTRAGLVIEDLGQFGGLWVNGQRSPQHGPLDARDEIVIGGHRLRIVDRLAREEGSARLPGAHDAAAAPAPFTVVTPAPPSAGRPSAQHFAWRRTVHEALLDTIDLRRRDLTRMSDEVLRAETESLIREIIAGQPELPAELDRETLVRDVLNEAIGLGPLDELLADEAITEIMVNRHDEIYVERGGRLERHPAFFTGDRAVLGIIERIVAPLGRRIDESSPMVDARLKDGSRVNAIIPPLAVKGPAITIRKFSRGRLEIADLLAHGSLSRPMADFLQLCVLHRKNVVVSGGTGSGKTTLLNVLSGFIPHTERLITIEDAAELRLEHPHLVSLEARPANAEGRGLVAIRDLVRNALRMRPDRIVVGECRGGEALDMLQAMNTGHEGSLTTLHANSPRDVLARLETMVLMAGMELPLIAIREQVGSAIDVVVQQTRFACGARKITSITEVTGMENGKLQLQELFRFEHHGYDAQGRAKGHYLGCDAVPSFYDELRSRGATLDLALFARREAA